MLSAIISMAMVVRGYKARQDRTEALLFCRGAVSSERMLACTAGPSLVVSGAGYDLEIVPGEPAPANMSGLCQAKSKGLWGSGPCEKSFGHRR